VGNSNGRFRRIQGAGREKKWTILRKKFSPPASSLFVSGSAFGLLGFTIKAITAAAGTICRTLSLHKEYWACPRRDNVLEVATGPAAL